MPKATSTPSKNVVEGRATARTSKKKVVSSAFVDDEAQESDDGDGVLVPRPDSEYGQTPPAYVSGDHESNLDEGDQVSADDFINDGDPYEGYQSDGLLSAAESPPPSPSKRKTKHSVLESPTPSPPSTPVKPRARPVASEKPFTPSPLKIRANDNSSDKEVIELDSSSEEDLEAMDVDDSEFKKPSGIKPASLPPSLTTRSVASKRGLAPTDPVASESGGPSTKRLKVSKATSEDAVHSVDPVEPSNHPFANNPEMAKMFGFFTDFMKQSGVVPPSMSSIGFGGGPVVMGPSSKKASRQLQSARVDHDELALQEGIQSSLGVPQGRDKSTPRYSPDWDPPDVADMLEEIADLKKAGAPEPSRPVKRVKSSAAASAPRAGGRVKSDVDNQDHKPSASGKASPAKSKSSAKNATLQSFKDQGKTDAIHPSSYEESSPAKSASKSREKSSQAVKKDKGKGKARDPPSDEDESKHAKPNTLSAYVQVKKFPVVAAAVGDQNGKPPVTMAQYMRMSRGDDEPEEDPADAEEDAADDEEPPVFLDDIEAYKAFFDPKAKCGVFDVKIQDPSMRPHYVGLPPLPGGRMMLAAFDPKRNSTDDIDYRTGGRVQFSSWAPIIPRMLAANSMGAMLFVECADRFFNLSRGSPLGLSAHTSAGSSQTARLQLGDKAAICLSAVCVTESCLFAPKAVGKGDRYRKWLVGVLHDYDHERLVSMLSLVFGEPVLYAQMMDNGISFQTMLSPANDNLRTPDAHSSRATKSVPSPNLFSSQSPSKSNPSRRSAANNFGKTLLAYNDTVPIYDARKIVVDFDRDLERLGQILPLFPGEIPVSSFVVVGYTVSCYNGTVSGSSSKAANVSFNILWAIVCGTPSPPSRT